MTTYNTFLIGLGDIGMGYDFEDKESQGRTHARAIQLHESFNFAGACDSSEFALAKFRSQYDVPTYNSISEGLCTTNPDVVVIAVPTKNHIDAIRETLSACRPRVILCEKPLAPSPSESKEILKICAESQTKVFVNYFRNSDPLVYKIKEQIDSGYYQKPFVATCIYNKGMLHTGSHFLNLLEILFGNCLSIQKTSKQNNWNDESDPNYLIKIKFQDGSASMIPDSFNSNLIFEMDVDFVNGTLRYLNEGQEIIWKPNHNKDSVGQYIEDEKFERVSTGNQYEVFSQIVNFLQNKHYNLCEISDSHKYVENLTEEIVEGAL